MANEDDLHIGSISVVYLDDYRVSESRGKPMFMVTIYGYNYTYDVYNIITDGNEFSEMTRIYELGTDAIGVVIGNAKWLGQGVRNMITEAIRRIL